MAKMNKDSFKKRFQENMDTPYAYPDPLVSDEEKDDESYGLQWGRAINWEWFSRTNYTANWGGAQYSRYYDKRWQFHISRLYSRGEQPTDFYKNLLGVDTTSSDQSASSPNGSNRQDTVGGQRSFSNYNWSPLKILPSIRRYIVENNAERFFNIRAEATDKYSTDIRNDFKEYLENQMFSQQMLKQAQELLGVQNANSDVPESQEEIDLHMKMKFKTNVEAATEEAIKFTFDTNDFHQEQKIMLQDVFECGVCHAEHYTDPTRGIILQRIDPADMVYAYPKNKNFKDVYYYGKVNRITISELKRVTQGKFTDEEYEEMAAAAGEWTSYQYLSNTLYPDYDDFYHNMVNILDFTVKVTNTIVYKKKNDRNGGFRMQPRESTFDKKNKDYAGFDVDKKIIDVWYKGSIVLGTNYIIKWEKCENLVRPEDYINKTIPPYISYAPELYQNRYRSMVLDAKDYIDQMQMIHIKMQAEIAKARVPGVRLDVSGLNGISLGDGNSLDPITQLRIYDDTGNVLWSSIDEHGNANFNRPPIENLPNGLSATFQNYIVAYNHYNVLLREALGIPSGVGTANVDPRLAVGVQEQLTVTSNTVNRHILDSVLYVTKILGNATYLRMKDIFMYSNLKKVYENAIGKIDVKLLESLKNYHLHYLGITIELKPDAQERALREQNIQQALQQGLIELYDADDIRSTPNNKIASALLKVRIEKRRKEIQQNELQKIEANNEGAAAAAERASAAKQQEYQIEAQSKVQVIQAQTQADRQLLVDEGDKEIRVLQQKYFYEFQLKGLETNGKFNVDKMKEDEKLRRQNINNTQSSQMIKQREVNGNPINFDIPEDSLEGSVELG